jgi:hypothetical protein
MFKKDRRYSFSKKIVRPVSVGRTDIPTSSRKPNANIRVTS